MGAWRAAAGAPRSLRGGRSARYEERRAARHASRAYAPRWRDSTAAAVMRVLREQSAAASQELTSFLGSFLQSGRSFSSLGRSGLGASEATEVEMIVAAHRAKLSHPGATVAKVVRAMLKPLYVRGAICKEGRVRLGVTQVHYRGLRDVLEDDEASRGPSIHADASRGEPLAESVSGRRHRASAVSR
jgi:hypothetical protein